MSQANIEFAELHKRYKQAGIYERDKYMSDSPEGKAWAEKTFAGIVSRMNELWDCLTEEERGEWLKLL